MFRWFLRIFIALIVLAILCAAGLQIALWSNLPHRLVISNLERKTGLNFSATSIRSGWTGRTELRDVAIHLPLEDQPLLEVDRLEVEHTALIPMLLSGGGVELRELTLREPKARLARNDLDQWNLQRAIQIVRETIRRNATGKSTAQVIALPVVRVPQGELTVVAGDGSELEIPFEFLGEPTAPQTWSFQSRSPDLLDVDGSIVTAGTWLHEAAFEFTGIEKALRVLADDLPELDSPVDFKGRWRGELMSPEAGLTGRLELQRLRSGERAVAGETSLALKAGELTLRDFALQIVNAESELLTNTAIAGESLEWSGSQVRARQVRIENPHVDAVVRGEWDQRLRRGQLQATWLSNAENARLTSRGQGEFTLQMPIVGNLQVSGAAQTTGSLGEHRWNATVDINASGPDWSDLQARLIVPDGRVHIGQREILVDGLMIQMQSDWPAIELREARLASQNLNAAGTYNVKSRAWSGQMAAGDFCMPGIDIAPSDIDFQAAGVAERIERATLRFQNEAIELHAAGAHTPSLSDQTLTATVSLRAQHPAELMTFAAAESAPFKQHAQGTWRGEFAVRGTLEPMQLEFEGVAHGRDIALAAASLEEIRLPLQGSFDGRELHTSIEDVEALDGNWSFNSTLSLEDRLLTLRAAVGHLGLDRISDFANVPVEIHGRMQGQADIVIPDLQFDRLKVDGHWSATEVHSGEWSFQSGSGTLHGEQGVIDLNDLRVQGTGDHLDAALFGSARYRHGTRTIAVDLTSENWPVSAPSIGADLLVNGDFQVAYNVSNKSAAGSADVRAGVNINQQHVADVESALKLDGRTLTISNFSADVLEGHITGEATIPIDQPTQATGTAIWRNLDLAALTAGLPEGRRGEGRVDGSASIKPANDPRALEPLRIDLNIEPGQNGVRFAGIQFGQANVTAFAGPQRFILNQSNFEFAGGTLQLWGRLSRHQGEHAAHIQANFKQFDLDQLADALTETDGDYPGRLEGSLSVGGNVRTPHRMYGRADVSLSQADLANLPIVSAIYGALNIGTSSRQPQGEGHATIRLEGDALEFSRVEYFNRGADVLARVRIHDIWKGGISPISGVAFGAVRPLRDLDLPFFSDLDRAVKAIQADAYSVTIEGTVRESEFRAVPFAEVGELLQSVLGGSP